MLCCVQLDKCCAVSRTFGERRLAHHLLTGVELLLGDLVPKTLPDAQVAALRAKFGPERGKPYTEVLFDPATCTKSASRGLPHRQSVPQALPCECATHATVRPHSRREGAPRQANASGG